MTEEQTRDDPPVAKKRRRTPRRRAAVLIFFVAVAIIALSTLGLAQTPWGEEQLETWIVPQIATSLGCEIRYRSLDLQLLRPRPRVVIKDLECDWYEEGAQTTTADEVTLSFARLQTYARSVHITRIAINGLDLAAHVKDGELVGIHFDSAAPSTSSYEVEIDEILVRKSRVSVTSDAPDVEVTLEEVEATITPDADFNCDVRLESRGHSIRYEHFTEALGEIHADLYLNAEPLVVDVRTATASIGASATTAKGTIGPTDTLDLQLSGTLPLRYVNEVFPSMESQYAGVARYDTLLKVREAGWEARGSARVPGLRLEGWPLGDVSIRFDADPRTVEIHDIYARGLSGGEVRGDLTVSIDDPNRRTTGNLRLANVRFEQLLEDNGVEDSHVTAGISGDLAIDGPILPMRINAELDAQVDGFSVRDRPYDVPDPDYMLQLPPTILKGTAVWGEHGFEVSQADATVGERTLAGFAGWVKFPVEETGYEGALDVDFTIGWLDFAEIGGIGSVPMKGAGSGRGRVWGSLDDVVITTNADLKGYDLADVVFGDAVGTIVWRDGFLSSPDTVIKKGRTIYQGDWEIDFNQDDSPITFNVLSEQGRLSDLFSIADPFRLIEKDVDGDIVRIQASLSGPIEELTGTFTGSATHVKAWGERFREVRITEGRFQDGRIELGNVFGLKKAGRVYGRGTLETDGSLNGEARTEAFTMEELDTFGPDFPLQGKLGARINVGGTTDKVYLNGWVQLTDSTLNRRAIAPSRIDLVTQDDVLSIKADFARGEMEGLVRVDLTEGLPYSGRATVTNHPVDPYLALMNPTVEDGVGRVTGTVEATGKVMELWRSDVKINVEDLFVARGARNITAPELFTLHWNQGVFSIDDRRSLQLIGPVDATTRRPIGDLVTDLEVIGTSRNARGDIDFKARGAVDLAFIDLFFDYFTRLEGAIVLTEPPRPAAPLIRPRRGSKWVATLKGRPSNVKLDVWGRVQNFAVRSKIFPLSVEDVRGMVHITQDQVVLGVDRNGTMSCRPGAAVEGKAGGGDFRGCGTLDIDGPKVTNWDVRATLLQSGRMRWDDPRMRFVVKSPQGEFITMRGRPKEDLLLSGVLDVEELRYQENFDWKAKAVAIREPRLLQTLPDEEEELFDIDITLRAPEGGVFLKNADANVEGKGELRVTGSTARWGLLGTLSLVQGTARFQDTEFTLTSGSLEFINERAVDFEIDTNGEAVVRDYTVYVSVRGRYLDESIHFDFESQPPLDPDQIHMLLLLKVPPGELTGQELTAAGALLGSVAGEGVAEQEGLLDVLRGGLPLDSVELVPTYSETGGDVGVSIVGRKLLGKRKNTEMTISLRPALGGTTEASTAWQLEHKAARRLRFTFGCDHGDREGGSGGTNNDTPEALQDIRSIGDCSLDTKFRFEFR